ncbi:MAG: NADH-quinone oxidoreductase subunit K [Marinilabiliales bacterium]
MEYFNLQNVSLLTGFVLILIGIWGILTQKNILKIIIGFSIFDTGLHVVMVSISYIKGRTAPIIDSAVNVDQAVDKVTDPIPQALVLTAIVIGLGITALMLSYALKMYKAKKSLDINNFNDIKW